MEVGKSAMSSPARRPLIISSKPRSNSKPWNYQGSSQEKPISISSNSKPWNYQGSSQEKAISSQPYCTVCVQPDEDIDEAVRRQIEQEVKMIRS